jgi:uncharacterized membrane protein
MTKRVTLIGLALTILVAALAATPALAAENSVGGPKIDWKDRPARELIVALAYPNVTLSPEDKIRVDLLVRNFGRTNETLTLEVTDKPKGWVVDLKGFGKSVGGVFLGGGEEKTLTLSADPEGKVDKLTPGTYHFAVKAKSADGAIVKDTAVTVKVVEKEKSSEAIKLTTSYPVLRGPSDARFEFSVDVHNDSDEDAIFNLGGQAPEGWELGFKPAYEQKQISSLRIKAGQSQAVGVEVTPARQAEAKDYPIKVRVQSQRAKAEVDLTVALTGTYKIKAATPSGLLSTTTQVGQSTNLSIYVRNDGSALQKDRKSTRLNSSHRLTSRMPSSA